MVDLGKTQVTAGARASSSSRQPRIVTKHRRVAREANFSLLQDVSAIGEAEAG